MLVNIPYDLTVFIEADCLVYGRINEYFDYFSKINGEFSCFGTTSSIESIDGYFKISEVENYKDSISFIPSFHSCVIFLKKGKICKKMYEICMEYSNSYTGNRNGFDDKLFAISSAVCGMYPIDYSINAYTYYLAFCLLS